MLKHLVGFSALLVAGNALLAGTYECSNQQGDNLTIHYDATMQMADFYYVPSGTTEPISPLDQNTDFRLTTETQDGIAYLSANAQMSTGSFLIRFEAPTNEDFGCPVHFDKFGMPRLMPPSLCRTLKKSELHTFDNMDQSMTHLDFSCWYRN